MSKDVLKQALEALKRCTKHSDEDYAAITAIEQALSRMDESVAKEIELNIIRRWPDGFADRMEHVWKDLIGFIPSYKLYDLQRMLAEYGFTMKVYEGTNLPPQQAMQEPVAWLYKGKLHKFDPSDWASPEIPITPLVPASALAAPQHRAPQPDTHADLYRAVVGRNEYLNRVLRQALEALTYLNKPLREGWDSEEEDNLVAAAITAIKDAMK